MRHSLRILAFALILVASVPSLRAQQFRDVATTPYATAFASLRERGAVQGFSDGSGRPYAGLNRAEAVKTLMAATTQHKQRVDWYRSHMPPLPLFWDIRQTDWYAPSIEAAFEAGIITGYSDQSFRPARLVTTEEAIALVLRAYGVKGSMTNSWYGSFLEEAQRKNLIAERAMLTPGRAITRGQFFELLYRMDTVSTRRLTAFEGPGVPASIVTAPIATIPAPNPNPSWPSQPIPTPVQPQPQQPHPQDISQYASALPFAVTIPSLGIEDLPIFHPGDVSAQGLLEPLKNGVGHLFSYPGGNGRILLYGHSSGYPGDISKYTKIFRAVNKLNKGDRVYVTFNGKLYVYEVTHEKSVPSNDTSYLAGSGEQLILYTCWPPDSIAMRYLIFASPVQTVALK